MTARSSQAGAVCSGIARADQLADAVLQRSGTDSNALFVKSLTLGLRADYAGLIRKAVFRRVELHEREPRFCREMVRAKPEAADAYLGPGLENYLLSLKPAPLRVLLRVTGSNVIARKAWRRFARRRFTVIIWNRLQDAAGGGGVRDKDPGHARELLGELQRRFPDNELYTREMNRIDKGAALISRPPRLGQPSPPEKLIRLQAKPTRGRPALNNQGGYRAQSRIAPRTPHPRRCESLSYHFGRASARRPIRHDGW